MIGTEYDLLDLVTLDRATEQWEWGESGLIERAPPGAPCYLHDPITGERLGIRMCPSSENFFSYSGIPPNPGPNHGVEDVASIFQGKTARRYTNMHDASASAGINQGARPLGQYGFAYRVIAESVDERSTIMLGFRDNDAPNWERGWTLDLNNPAAVPEHWQGANQDCEIHARLISPNSVNGGCLWEIICLMRSQLVPGNAIGAYIYPGYVPGGVRASSIIHHRQLEAGAWPTSPIWTDEAPAIRAMDDCYIPDLSRFVIPDPGRTLVMEWVTYPWRNPQEICGGASLIRVNEGILDRVAVGMRNAGGLSGYGQVVNSEDTSPFVRTVPGDYFVRNRIGISYSSSEAAFAFNGEAASAETSVGVPVVSRDRLTIGHAINSARMLNGYIASIFIDPRAYSRDELAEATQL